MLQCDPCPEITIIRARVDWQQLLNLMKAPGVTLLAGIEMEIVNSCENNNGGCSHHCQHSSGGPVCSCNHGYRLDSDLKTCTGKMLQQETFISLERCPEFVCIRW